MDAPIARLGSYRGHTFLGVAVEDRDVIRFTLNGQRYELSHSMVEARLANVVPGVVQERAVKINNAGFPFRQAFEVAVSVPRSAFISHATRRHLAALGFEVHGEIESRDAPSAAPHRRGSPAPAGVPRGVSTWRGVAHRGNVQAAVVTALTESG